MRIAIIAPEVFPVPPVRGGAVETVIEEVGARLPGAEVHIFSVADPSLPFAESRCPQQIMGTACPCQSKIENRKSEISSAAPAVLSGHRFYHRWRPAWLDRLMLSSWKLPFKQSRSRWYYWPYGRWAARHVARIQPDIVWVHSRLHFVPQLRRAAPAAKIVLSLHNESNLLGDRAWSDRAIAACDVVTGCSRSLVDAIEAAHPASAGSTVVLYNGVDVDRFSPRWVLRQERERLRKAHHLEGPTILYVGRLVEEKGVHVLIDAFKRMGRQQAARARQQQQGMAGATLLIVGSHTFSDGRTSPYIQRLREAAAGWEERIRFIGHVPHEEVSRYFVMSDVLAVPSIWREPFGMVVVEAMSTGLPVIAFDQGGPAELIRHGVSGFLVPAARGAEGFAQALEHCHDSSTVREVIGREARWTVEERFRWDHVAEAFLSFCKSDPPRNHPMIVQGSGFWALGKSDGNNSDVSPIPNPAPRTPNHHVILIAESGSGYGGSAKYLSELLGVIGRHRYDVHVVAAEAGPFIATIQAQGVPVTLRPEWRFPWEQKRGRRLREAGEQPPETRNPKPETSVRHAIAVVAQLTMTVPAIVLWLRRRRIRLVHLNNEILSHLPLLIASRMAGCRVVCHLHGWRPFTRTERVVVGCVDQFVCISEAGAQFYRAQLNGREVLAIPNGLHLNGQAPAVDDHWTVARERFGLRPEESVVAILGRLVPWKGQEVFLKALARLAGRCPTVTGLIIGHDTSPGQQELARLRAVAHALGLDARVRFIPWQEDVWSIYAAADVIVHASTKPEPFGLVLLEAMAARRPVVATRAGGVVDVVRDGETGLLVEPGDSDALSAAIERLLNDPVLVEHVLERAAERLREHFTIERNAAHIMGLYDQLLDLPAVRAEAI